MGIKPPDYKIEYFFSVSYHLSRSRPIKLKWLKMKDFTQYHHRRSIRLQGYDYSQKGMYFITVNTHERQRAFGFIDSGIMHLSDIGTVAQRCWLDIPFHYPNVVLHEFIVMPDHIHGIIEIIEVQNLVESVVVVGAQDLEPRQKQHQQNFEPQHIIRNAKSYKRISQYIKNNPGKWVD